ncbi:hypothetical protein ACB098_01G307000 [Castanea mollissima]
MCERLSSMAIIVNMVIYLVGTMHLPSASASNFASTSRGTSYLLCLVGGIVADSFIGRYWTIAIAAAIHAGVEANSLQMSVFTMALYLTNIGIGGIKSSVAGLGTDQFDQKYDKEKAQMAHFFDTFYFVTSLGTLLAVTVFVYIQDQVGRSWAYGICSASMTLALLVFLLGLKELDRLCTVTKVEEVKILIKLLPIWATAIIFWTIHAQLASFSVQQAATMDRSIGNFQIPAASLYAFFVVAIVITLAIYDRLIMPLMKKSRNCQGLTNLQKVGLGMAAAALVEKRRLSITLPISAFLLLPQFILVGIGEAFILSGELDFFTNNAPNGMKAITTVITNFTGRNGGHNWLPPSINDGRLDYFYWLLALLTMIDFGFYIVCTIRGSGGV